jgi:hypothetical protein
MDDAGDSMSNWGALGNRVLKSTPLLFAYVAFGVALTSLCLLAGAATNAADPTAGCKLANNGKPFVAHGGVVDPNKSVLAQPPGIVALEFAGQARAAGAIVGQWAGCSEKATSLAHAHRALILDTRRFIPTYVASLIWWCLYVTWAAVRRRGRRLAQAIAAAVVVAGALDLIENFALFHVIAGNDRWATLATATTMPKWVILLSALPVAVAGFAGSTWRLAQLVFLGEGSQPAFYGPQSAGEPPILDPLGPAHPDSERTRRRSKDPHGKPWPAECTGICLSGGGIRSASFALGVIQALHETTCPGTNQSVYQSADYLATVSGGGYTGTAAQIVAHQDPGGPPPFMAGSTEEYLLRLGRRYLWGALEPHHRWQSTREFVRGVTLFVAGIAFNVAVVVACVFVASNPLGWVARTAVFAGGGLQHAPPRTFTRGLVIGLIGAALVLAAIHSWTLPDRHETSNVVRRTAGWGKIILAMAMLGVVLAAGFSGWFWLILPGSASVVRGGARGIANVLRKNEVLPPVPPPAHRARWFTVSSAWGLAGLVATSIWYWTNQAFIRGTAGPITAKPALVVIAVVVGLVSAVLIGAAARFPVDWLRRKVPVVWSQWLFLLSVLVTLGLAAILAIIVLGALRARTDDMLGSDIVVWLAVATGLGVVYLFGDQKWWSPHPLYKARLSHTFALSRQGPLDPTGSQKAMRLPQRVRTTLSEWAAKPPNCPELLICAAAYDSVERPADGLRTWPFVFSQRYVGGSDVGWARTVDFEAALGRSNQSDGTLEAAMAISGAAVSPAIGRIPLGSANALMATADLRLGVWLPSPRTIQRMRTAASTSKSKTAPSWIRARRFTYLLKEIGSGYDLDARLIYLTDGGQFDNLGLFELLARGCTTIYCFDASGDLKAKKPLSTTTFDETREFARVRLGVVFSRPGEEPDGAAPTDAGPGVPITRGALTMGLKTEDRSVKWDRMPLVKVAEANTTVLCIHYPNGKIGHLAFGKCVLTGDLPPNSAAVQFATGPVGYYRFPADSTADQWLDETQVEAYVDLGRTVGHRAATELHAILADTPTPKAPSGTGVRR